MEFLSVRDFDFCPYIHFLLLHNKLPQIYWLKTTADY